MGVRTIIFRGKRADNGEWVYGDLRHGGYVDEDTQMYIMQTDYALHNIPIIPETLGQYTGLTDKNGVKIFEGDMLKPFDDEFDKMVVEFHDGGFMLCIYGERGYMGESGAWISEGNYGLIECELLSSYGDDIEVIGNIHDDPELLEVEYVTCKSKRDVRINHQ